MKAKLRDLHVSYTLGFCEGLEHLMIETRLIDESFARVMGECVILMVQVHRRKCTHDPVFIFTRKKILCLFSPENREKTEGQKCHDQNNEG